MTNYWFEDQLGIGNKPASKLKVILAYLVIGAVLGTICLENRAERARKDTRNICTQIEKKQQNPRETLTLLGFDNSRNSSIFGTNEIPRDYAVRFVGPWELDSPKESGVILNSSERKFGMYLGKVNKEKLKSCLDSLSANSNPENR